MGKTESRLKKPPKLAFKLDDGRFHLKESFADFQPYLCEKRLQLLPKRSVSLGRSSMQMLNLTQTPSFYAVNDGVGGTARPYNPDEGVRAEV